MASIISVTRIGGVGLTLAVTSNVSTLRSVLQFLVTASVVTSSHSCDTDDGGDTFLRNFDSYKSNMA
jgi:hypothetical protein